MFRKFLKVVNPVRIHLARAVGGNGVGGTSASTNNAFQRNCVSKEQQMTDTLKQALPGITYVSVQDISGGCGAMFEISIEAKEFNGLNKVKQHRLVTESLKSEIAEMHGIRIHTTPSPSDS